MTTGTSNQPDGDSDAEATPPDSSETNKTFSQEEVNRMMGRTRRETEDKFSDYTALKANADLYEQSRQAQLTAEEKAREELADSQRENAQLQTQMVTTAIVADIKTRAFSAGVDPDVAVAMVDRSGIQFDGVGQTVTGTDDAIRNLLEAKPFLSTSNSQAPVGAPNITGGNTPSPPPSASLTQDEKLAAAATGISEEQYAAAKARQPSWRGPAS